MQSSNNYDGFYLHLGKKYTKLLLMLLKNVEFSGLMLLYLSCMQIFLTAFIYFIPLSNTATIISSTCLMAFFMSCGYTVHFKDITSYTKWLQYLSPITWLFPYLLNREFTPEAIASSSVTTLCRNKQVRL